MRQQKYFLWKNVFSKRQLETVTYVRSYLDRSRLSQPACFRDTFNHLKQHWFIQLQFNLQDSWNSNCQICQTHRRRLRKGFQQLPITNNLLTRKKSSLISTNKLPEKWSSLLLLLLTRSQLMRLPNLFTKYKVNENRWKTSQPLYLPKSGLKTSTQRSPILS